MTSYGITRPRWVKGNDTMFFYYYHSFKLRHNTPLVLQLQDWHRDPIWCLFYTGTSSCNNSRRKTSKQAGKIKQAIMQENNLWLLSKLSTNHVHCLYSQHNHDWKHGMFIGVERDQPIPANQWLYNKIMVPQVQFALDTIVKEVFKKTLNMSHWRKVKGRREM